MFIAVSVMLIYSTCIISTGLMVNLLHAFPRSLSLLCVIGCCVIAVYPGIQRFFLLLYGILCGTFLLEIFRVHLIVLSPRIYIVCISLWHSLCNVVSV